MKKGAKTALIIAAILIVVGGIMVCVAAWNTVGGWRQLFLHEMAISGDDFTDWYERHWGIVYDQDGDGQRDGAYTYLTYTPPEDQEITSIEVNNTARDIVVCPTLQPGLPLSVVYAENNHERYDIQLSNGKLTITARYKDSFEAWDDWDMTIYIPEGIVPDLSLYVTAGDIDIEYAALNELDISSTAGDVDIENIRVSGPLSISSTAGDIDLDYSDIGGQLDISSMAGSVKLEQVSAAGPVSVSTTAGDISLEYLTADVLSVQATAGSVDCLLEGSQSDYYVELERVLESFSFGHKDSAKRVRIQTTAGEIDLDFTE